MDFSLVFCLFSYSKWFFLHFNFTAVSSQLATTVVAYKHLDESFLTHFCHESIFYNFRAPDIQPPPSKKPHLEPKLEPKLEPVPASSSHKPHKEKKKEKKEKKHKDKKKHKKNKKHKKHKSMDKMLPEIDLGLNEASQGLSSGSSTPSPPTSPKA